MQATAEKVAFSEEQLLALLALARKGIGKLVDLQKLAVMWQCTGRSPAALVIATHNAGKLRRDARAARAYGIEAVSAGELNLPEPEETGTTFVANARIKAEAAAQAAGLPALPTISGLRSMRSTARPASIRRAGPARRRISHARWSGSRRALRERDAFTPEQRKAHFVSALASPGRTAMSRNSRAASTARWSGRRAATRASATIRCFFPTALTDLRRDESRRKARTAAEGARALASRARLPQARGGVPWQPTH